MYNLKIKFLLNVTCLIMTAIILNMFSFAAGPSDESMVDDSALGSSSSADIKLPYPLFIDTAAAREKTRAAAIEQAQEAARIEEANRIQEEQQARIDAKKKKNRRRQQRKQQNMKNQNYVQQNKQSEERDQFMERMKKYMK